MRTIARPVTAAVAGVLLLSLCAAPASALEEGPHLLGANTAAAAAGLPLNDLVVSGGEVYSSYGDYDRNVGPVELASLNTATGAETRHLTVNGEELKALREFDGRVFAADVDPRTAWSANAGFASNRSGAWNYDSATPFIHVFDVAELGGEIFLAGSILNPDPARFGRAPYLAVIKKSTDNGRTWTIERARSSASGSNDGDRYYWLAVVGDQVAGIAEVRDAKGAPNRTLDVYRAGRWHTIDLGARSAEAMVHDPSEVEVIGSRIVIARNNRVVYLDLAAKGKDAGIKSSNWPADIGLADLAVDRGVMYAVGSRIAGPDLGSANASVYATRDGATWQLVDQPAVLPATTYWDHGGGEMIPIPGAYTAIDVAGGQMYLGGNDAQIYAQPAPSVR